MSNHNKGNIVSKNKKNIFSTDEGDWDIDSKNIFSQDKGLKKEGHSYFAGKGNIFRNRQQLKVFRFTVVTSGAIETFTLPLRATGTYDFHVDWGDSNSSDITVWDHADVTHTYAVAGTYTISITGTIVEWTFRNFGDKTKIYEIKSWGPLRLGNEGNYFYGCSNLTVTATDVLDLAGTTKLEGCFRSCSSLITIPSINSWDASLVTDPQTMFYGCTLFNQDISTFLSLINPTITQYMFRGCTAFNQDVSMLDMSGVSNATSMFLLATSFNQDLSSWDISALTNLTNFFAGVTLFTANYNALILSWSAQAQTIVANFHGGNSEYTGGGVVAIARAVWQAKGWTILDGGIA